MPYDCVTSGNYSICSIGNILENDSSIDPVTNTTYAYVSCVDRYGNLQTNTANQNIGFSLDLENNVFDDYDGQIKAPGYAVGIRGSTYYCVDAAGTCTPSDPIVNNSLQFNQAGQWHLRYYLGVKTMDTTVFINSPPKIAGLEYSDILGTHSFAVYAKITDIDDQKISCNLTASSQTKPMDVAYGRAYALVEGLLGESVSVSVTCSDGFAAASASGTHNAPNSAPVVNRPFISVRRPGRGRDNIFDNKPGGYLGSGREYIRKHPVGAWQ
jgi:hypothetical protein